MRPPAAGGAVPCSVCGAEAADGAGGAAACSRCGYPELPEEAARFVMEGEELLAAGSVDRSVRRFQQAAKLSPDASLPHIRMAAAYERKSQEGETAFLRLAERELREAVRLAPGSREAHVARISLAAKAGGLAALKTHYESRIEEYPFSRECLNMIGALEELAKTRDRVDRVTGAAKTRARYLFLGAGGAGLAGLLELALVIYRSLEDEYSLAGSPDFYICVALFTGGTVMALEGWRALKGGT